MMEEAGRSSQSTGDIIPQDDDYLDESARESRGRSDEKSKLCSGSSSTRKRKSKYELLDEKWNTKFASLDDEFYSLCELIRNQGNTANGDKNSDENRQQSQRHVVNPPRHSSEEENDEDYVSLAPGQDEVLGSASDQEDTSLMMINFRTRQGNVCSRFLAKMPLLRKLKRKGLKLTILRKRFC
ncbi:hypothetical protein SNE40_013187 [Patella caerulea]|uniref:Uncharacterized protein n=1 Tax=Patella caerulea TaxID=87958 RepID=A0AAN8PGP5_PATCE